MKSSIVCVCTTATGPTSAGTSPARVTTAGARCVLPVPGQEMCYRNSKVSSEPAQTPGHVGLGALSGSSSSPLCPGCITVSLSSSPANLQPGNHGGPKPRCALCFFRFLIIHTQQGVRALSRRPFKTQLLWTRTHAGWPPGGHILQPHSDQRTELSPASQKDRDHLPSTPQDGEKEPSYKPPKPPKELPSSPGGETEGCEG